MTTQWSLECDDSKFVMDETEHNAEPNGDKHRLNAWAYVSIAVILVFLGAMTVAISAATFLYLRHTRSSSPLVSTSIIVKHPIFISGPSIEMSLPAGSDLTSATVNTEGGNWWYENADSGHVHLLIAASRIGHRQPEVTDAYFERVIRIVEQTAEDQITTMGSVQESNVDSYSALTVTYEVQPIDGGSEHAVAMLVRRESDDLLIILYGDDSVRDEIDHASEQMFQSLHPRPTPDQYDVHSADITPTHSVVGATSRLGAII